VSQVSGRILIDTYGYNKHHGALPRTENKERKQRTENPFELANAVTAGNIGNAGKGESSDENSAYITRLSDEEQQENKDEMLAREQDLVFLSPILTGFSLKEKLWCQFSTLL
jgi:hypothetical protein